MKINIPTEVFYILNKLKEKGFLSYLVGGCIRNLLLNLPIYDYDIATSATPMEIKEIFDKTISVGEIFGKISVIINNYEVEVSTFRHSADRTQFGGTLFEDTSTRDFTINSLAHPCFNSEEILIEELIDYHGAISDLEDRFLRAIGDPLERMKEDPLRIMRAIRFTASLTLVMDPLLVEVIKHHSDLLDNISKERIRDEFLKILTGNNPVKGIELLTELGIINRIIPGFTKMIGCTQPYKYHPEGDVYVHTLKVLENIPKGSSKELFLAAILHDISKPECRIEKDSKITFYNHDRVGSEKTKTIMKDLKFPNECIDEVVYLVHNHMKMHHWNQMNKSTRIKMCRNKYFKNLIELAAAGGKGAASGDQTSEIREFYEEVPVAAAPKLITGDDLIDLGFPPGKIFGTIIDKVEDLHLEGDLKTREEAIEYIRTHLFEFQS